MTEELNWRGFIPGPGESEAAYLERVHTLQHLPPPSEAPLAEEDWKDANALTQHLFDFSVQWVPAFYSNRNLPFWQGAAVWISHNLPIIQLRTAFRKGSYLGLYARAEILAHEAAHAARSAFDEPRFEEILAYSTSRSAWRRWLGPLFRHSWESYLFIFLLLSSLGAQTLRLFYDNNLLSGFVYLPWLSVLWMLGRLSYHHHLLKRCLRNLSPLLKDPARALAVAFRLTDREITDCARGIQIRSHLQSDSSMRGKVILSYFK
jgi:hypothetical protein